MNAPDVSIVIPVRNEAGNIGPLIDEIRTVLGRAGIAWELSVVDDGSTDASWAEIVAAGAADARVQGIRQERPLGKSAALAAGFARCRAAKIAMLDGDGQDDPAEIPGMLALIDSPSPAGRPIDLVNGWKMPRLDPWHKTLPSQVFNGLVGLLTGLHLHDHNCGLKVFRAAVAERIPLDTGMHRFIPVLAAAAGFRVMERPVHHRPRTRGQSKYGMLRFFAGLYDLVRVAARVRGRGLLAGAQDGSLPRSESRGRLRRGIYALLATLAVGAVLGRIGAVTSVDKLALEKRLVTDAIAKATAAGLPVDAAAIRSRIEQEKRLMRPFLSANDRSRWLAVRALAERGEFAIDGLVTEPGWDTIDAVAHADASGRLRLYSSKPPLLSVLCAGPYWLLMQATGWTLGDHPFEMGRLLMVLYGLAPLLVTILFTCRLIEAVGTTDWGRLWAAAVIACGTLLTTFAVVFTNHLPAAACTAASAWLLLRIRCDGLRSWRAFAAGEDIHTSTAAAVFAVEPAAVTSAMRRTAKAVNFGILYGQSSFGLAKSLSIPQAEAARFITAYFQTFAGAAAFMDDVLDRCRQDGYVTTMLGRRRAITGVRDRAGRRNAAGVFALSLPERTAINTVVQGSAADLIKLAMLGVASRLKATAAQAAIVLQIHDELLLESPPAEAGAVREIVVEEMQQAMVLDVPLEVSVHEGATWAECEKGAGVS